MAAYEEEQQLKLMGKLMQKTGGKLKKMMTDVIDATKQDDVVAFALKP